ncbi:DUF4439 domain-containing protein [Nocardioides litoris]|uniref:DUF4439 domain-containing protein n=1 Tax=Nocardioides litoris TaxID=1926648 RepID=UPI001122B76A|nr:DUF4439 domain-containing protein [Nocardioides litoris]
MTYVDALQAALAAEHAALFVVGYLGAQTSESASPDLYDALQESYDAHRTRRDQLVGLVEDAGAEPVAAAPSYALPQVGPGAAGQVAAAALAVERACGATYGFWVANAAPAQRRPAVAAVLDSARRELALGGEPRAYPGR